MNPKLPFSATSGQCLPACLALLLNDPKVLTIHQSQPKSNGHTLADLAFILAAIGSELRIDIMGAHKAIRGLHGWNKDVFIPFVLQAGNHAVLVFVANKKFFIFDAVSSEVKELSLHGIISYIDSDKEPMAAVFIDENNVVLGLLGRNLQHLFDK
jgi:hypothetical protein